MSACTSSIDTYAGTEYTPVLVVTSTGEAEAANAYGLSAIVLPIGGPRALAPMVHGKHVAFLCRPAGLDHIEGIADAIADDAASVKVQPIEGGLSAWFHAGGTRLDLLAALADCPTRERKRDDAPAVLDPADPLPSAKLFMARQYREGQTATLLHHGGDWLAWRDGAYRPVDDATVKAQVYAFTESAVKFKKQDGKDTQVPFQPNRAKVENIIDALKATANLPAHVQPPCWLDGRTYPPANEILPHRGGLLHLPSGANLPPTPAFYCRSSLDFCYDPAAPAPARWLAFLRDLWPDDAESIDALQEVFGYLLSEDTRQQKLFLMVGPKRSGKGTIARVLTALRGRANVDGPTLAGLGTPFGLASLIGKPVAIISDARLSGRADQAAIAERLLSISGEDTLTIDRKYRDPWTGRLSARFVVLTNELPRLADASGALSSRFIVLTLSNSFYGREDPGLTEKLLAELPGILNWSIAGWRRLEERGRFIQPSSSADAISELEDLGSPIGAFIRDECEVAPGRSVEAGRLYNAWCEWCRQEGRDHPGTAQTFGRDLRAAVSTLRTTRPRHDGGTRLRWYEGIDLAT